MVTPGDGEVAVDWESIRPTVEEKGWVVVRFRPHLPWPVGAGPRDLLEAVDRPRLVANELFAGIVEVYDVSPCPTGPVLVIEDGEPQEKRAWLAEIGRGLAEGGWSGRLERVLEPDPPSWTVPSSRWLTAFTAYPIADPSAVLRGRGWGVDAARTRSICHAVTDWTLARGGDTHLTQDRSTTWAADHDIVGELMVGLDWSADAALTAYQEPPAARSTSLSSHGQVMHTVVDSTGGWRAELDALLHWLRQPPTPLDLAFVRRALGMPGAWDALASTRPRLPYVREPDVRLNRASWAERVPDAHGVQVLTDAHLARVRDLSTWDVTTLDDGRHLVQARDPEPWFATEEADPAVLAAAREDFGDAIMRPEK